MTAALLAARPEPRPPAIARRVRIGMPQLDAGGLSENWLWRYAGDRHWAEISRRLATASHEIRCEDGARLYPAFVAVRARYGVPLAAVRENDVLGARARVVPCGRACAHGTVSARVGGHAFELELITTFARRTAGELRMTLPAARLAARWRPVLIDLSLERAARAARRGEGPGDPAPGAAPLGRVDYEPSPYADYNGARLLYFASYVSIADTALRRLVRSLGLAPDLGADWALAASPIARDVFYYGNLPLGEGLTVELSSFARDPGGVSTRMRLCRADGTRMADVVTRHALGAPEDA